MIGPAGLSVLFLWFMFSATVAPVAVKHLTIAEVQKIVAERKDARFCVVRGVDGTKTLHITLPEDDRHFSVRAVADEATLKVLEANGANYATGTVDSQEAWPFGFLLPVFIASLGVVLLLRQIGKVQRETTVTATAEILEQQNSKYAGMLLEVRADPMTRRVFGIAFAVVFLLAFSANAFTAKGLYVVLFVGLVKGAFLGLVAAIGIICLRTRRKAS
jgi:hypothetical protein